MSRKQPWHQGSERNEVHRKFQIITTTQFFDEGQSWGSDRKSEVK